MESLHGVRKAAAKPWRRPEVTPPRVYRVQPRDFRRLVQSLTGADAPPTSIRPLRETANPPPPLDLAPRFGPLPPSVQVHKIVPANGLLEQFQGTGAAIAPTAEREPLGMLSPNWSLPWCSFLQSPGSLAALESSSSPVL